MVQNNSYSQECLTSYKISYAIAKWLCAEKEQTIKKLDIYDSLQNTWCSEDYLIVLELMYMIQIADMRLRDCWYSELVVIQ